MLLEICNATKIYGLRGGGKGEVIALQDFNLQIRKSPASITAIAGESGSGKTTLANAILGFTRLTSGEVIYDGQDISRANRAQIKDYRRNVQAVFQDPFGVYNPFYRVQHVFNQVIRNFNLNRNRAEWQQMIEEALNAVGLHGQDVLRKYPHQLSGGQRQRIMMARAYMIEPRLIVADEPVSMVDASLRASILDVMLRLKEENGISFLYITHDLSTAYQVGDQIHVLYQGSVAEKGPTFSVIDRPRHPYVQLLVDSVPVPDPSQKNKSRVVLKGDIPTPMNKPSGCAFRTRCPIAKPECANDIPPLIDTGNEHLIACPYWEEKF